MQLRRLLVEGGDATRATLAVVADVAVVSSISIVFSTISYYIRRDHAMKMKKLFPLSSQGVVFNTTRKGPDKLVVPIVTVFVPIVTKYT
jgi:hypothetical protein